jgi:hypothetical protein
MMLNKRILFPVVILVFLSGLVLAGQTIIQKGSIITDVFNATALFVERVSGYQLKGDIDASGNLVKNLAEPENPQDAATKAYVDSKLLAFNIAGCPPEVSGNRGDIFIKGFLTQCSYKNPYDTTGSTYQEYGTCETEWLKAGSGSSVSCSIPYLVEEAGYPDLCGVSVHAGDLNELTGSGYNTPIPRHPQRYRVLLKTSYNKDGFETAECSVGYSYMHCEWTLKRCVIK